MTRKPPNISTDPGWLNDEPAVIWLGADGTRALIVPLTAEGLAHAVAAGAADIQVAALRSTGIAPDPGPRITWRYTATKPELLPREVADAATLDRLVGRHDRHEPLLVAKRQSTGLLQQVLHVPSDLAWFDGHFPDEPILAGVVQLHWAIAAAQALRDSAAQPHSIQQLKFKSPIRPESIVELTAKTAGPGGTVTFVYRSASGEHSSARIGFGAG